MDSSDRSKYIISTPGILKTAEMISLVIGLILFNVNNNCPSDALFVTLYVLPTCVCTVATLVSYVTALLLHMRRNPFTIKHYVKGEVSYNTGALLVMGMGTIITLTNQTCSNRETTIVAIVMGFVSAVLFATSGAVTWMYYVRYQEKQKRIQAEQLETRRVTLSAVA